MARLFGTDGVRGLANEVLTVDLAVKLGAAAAAVFSQQTPTDKPVAIIGRDPRMSGTALEAALAAGIASQGVDVQLLGVVPTPAVAHAVAQSGALMGAMISASHNAMPDNGIKFFSCGGHKLSDATEEAIEAELNSEAITGPTGAGIGTVSTGESAAAVSSYVDHIVSTCSTSLDGITVVVDCANGAASHTAPRAYEQAGAHVITIHAEPNGANINEGCGSTHLENLQAAVVKHGADLGLAHDGDADRCLAVDSVGNVVSGDEILAILAISAAKAGTLADNTLVATVMSNLGLHQAMKANGIAVETTAVGDRYVLERLNEKSLSLGGEQSGHVVMPAHITTGDGTLTGLALMEAMSSASASIGDLASVMSFLPQKLINVAVSDKEAVPTDPRVVEAVQQAEQRMGDSGRVLLRASGTEQVVRVMVEAPTEEEALSEAQTLADVVAQV